ncbi:tail assembly chaperone [Limosilactobacillus pontis]|uniref:Tail assembly chaperone n=1 Tax=Limosilactobacillus pontis TaxID=35787 RepID=A0ABU7SUH8_9LACO
MESLTIQTNPQATPQVFTPKLNFAFYRQTRDDKELKDQYSDGFTTLVKGLLNENADMTIAFYYHALAWYKRNQPSETAVEEALEEKVFANDEATDKAFNDILHELQKNDFLARKLSEFIKNQDKDMDAIQVKIDQTDDKNQRQNLEIGLQQMTDEVNKLKSLLATPESLPKPEDADSHQEN